MTNLHSKIYSNKFTSNFKGDVSGNLGTRQTPGMLYSKAIPTPVAKPTLLAWSEELAKELEIDPPTQEDIKILGGNLVTPTMFPYAACYAGHQFGNWAGQLGDGRAITLGEWETSNGNSYELQLKGAGPTPYSRRADGRAVLRSSLREYLMSEAMHYLKVPTTRAISLVNTGDKVMRDMFYNGHHEYEDGAIVMRVAPSFLRFGNFEVLAARQENENLQNLVDWTISKFYPQISGDTKILQWFEEVLERTAQMVVEWFRVGFVHGVMNTDNMSILGLTIDYGPFSFVDEYDPEFTPNTTDLPGRRYAFGKQGSVAFWNLECLAGAISPLFKKTDELVAVLEKYENIFLEKYNRMMGNKLGLDLTKATDLPLFEKLQKTLSLIKPDMTIFYQLLIELPMNAQEINVAEFFHKCLYNPLTEGQEILLKDFVVQYLERISQNSISRDESQKIMRENNPRFILRNYLLFLAIEELEKGDDQLFVKLQAAMKEPYSSKFDEFLEIRPAWASQKAGCSMLSCSS